MLYFLQSHSFLMISKMYRDHLTERSSATVYSRKRYSLCILLQDSVPRLIITTETETPLVLNMLTKLKLSILRWNTTILHVYLYGQ